MSNVIMHLLIYHPYVPQRAEKITIDNLYHSCGFSGTENAFLEIGKYLVNHGVKVHVLGITNVSYLDESSGVYFYALQDFPVEQARMYHWYTPLFYTNDPPHYQILEHLDPMHTKVFVWFHCFLWTTDQIKYMEQKGFDVYGVCVSQWVKEYYTKDFAHEKLWVVENGISTLFHSNVSSPSGKRGNWIFHAVFERGGIVATKAFERISQIMPSAAHKLNVMSYFTEDDRKLASIKRNKNIVFHGSVSKTKVRDMLADTEYFVYPLVLPDPDNDVHHDTYGCCILEALAMGVIVVTWNVGCIPVVYKDLVVAIPPPESHPGHIPYVKNPWFNSDEALMTIVNTIVTLEVHPEKKEAMRNKGMEWARQQLWSSRSEVMLEMLRTHPKK